MAVQTIVTTSNGEKVRVENPFYDGERQKMYDDGYLLGYEGRAKPSERGMIVIARGGPQPDREVRAPLFAGYEAGRVRFLQRQKRDGWQ